MTVIQPNSVAGINSITVQSGNSLAVHKANGELIRTITSNSGVSTFSSISVGTAATTNSAGKSINIGLGASISQHVDNSLSFGTGGDERARIDSSGRLLIGHTATTSKDRQVQLVGTTADGSSYMALRHSADANGSRLDLCKSRNATPGSNTIVVDDDVLGSIDFLGDDGTDIQSVGASIVAQVDGTPGSNDMPGRLIFRTTADGAAASTERLRIDSSGRLLIGTATASSAGNSQYSKLEVSGNTSGATGAGHLSIKRGTAVGSLSSGDTLGRLVFSGLDGGDFAYIQVSADAAPGSSDYPGRMMFFTTADGASSSTERLRIDKDGQMGLGMTPTRMFEVKDSTGANRIANIRGTGASGAYLAFLDQNTTDDSKCRVGSSGGNNLVMRGDTVQFATGAGTEFGRFDSSGRLLIGHTASHSVGGGNSLLQIQATNSTGRLSVVQHRNEAGGSPFISLGKSRGTSNGSTTILQSGDEIGTLTWAGADGNDLDNQACCITGAVDGTPGSNDMPGRLEFRTTADGASSATERLRIDSAGAIRFGATAAIQSEKFTFFRPEADQNTLAYFHSGASSDVTGVIFRHGRALSGFNGKQIGFLRNDGTEVGSIVSGNSSTAFNTSSDYRLKENQVSISDGITRLKTLKPYRFNFKEEPSVTVDGFFAHEVTAVPEAIAGTKDAVDSDNKPVYQGIDQAKLVPLLTAALQEAITKIETLETKVAALEGG